MKIRRAPHGGERLRSFWHFFEDLQQAGASLGGKLLLFIEQARLPLERASLILTAFVGHQRRLFRRRNSSFQAGMMIFSTLVVEMGVGERYTDGKVSMIKTVYLTFGSKYIQNGA